MPQIKDIAITKTVAGNDDLLIMQNPETGETYNITGANFLKGASSSTTTPPVQPTSNKLTGVAFGTSPAYTSGREYDKAFDGNTSTIFDFMYPSGGYCGIDLGPSNAKKLTKVRVYPRQDAGVQTRTTGAKIQGSNTAQDSGYVDLFTFPSTPDINTWYEGTITTSTAYRYLRYYGADNTYCNVSEVEFYGT
ncbi:discoidin domain-containing protein [Nostoc sp.]|uniref:discoidin domain-containing protein n=1 Tax=Nostoc sp. TaxID=1180 RepID=UPI002FF98AF1